MWLRRKNDATKGSPDGAGKGEQSVKGARAAHKRAFVRHAITTPALCRMPNGKLEAMVSNLSCHGCCLATQGELLASGQRVSLRIGGYENLSAEVRWVIGARAGVAFDLPLHGPVFDHLMSLHGFSAEMNMES